MQLSSNGHIQRSAAQWSEIITRYRQSGMGSRQFCAEEGLTLRTFEKWYGRIRRSETNKGKFVEVKNLAASCEAFTKTILTATVVCVIVYSLALGPGSECTSLSRVRCRAALQS